MSDHVSIEQRSEIMRSVIPSLRIVSLKILEETPKVCRESPTSQ